MAESYLKTSIALEPEYIGTYYWLGKTYQKLGKSDDALAVFRRGIKLLPPYKREEAMYKEMIKILEKNDRKKS
jgi:tetratricopeptide (TPR) repeat protein